MQIIVIFSALLLIISPTIESCEQWWEHAHIYQIFPLSFQDSDGNGYGDLRGIIERLPYIKSLETTAVWLQPIYPSPLGDTGYDITDYKNINSLLGTLDDFRSRTIQRLLHLEQGNSIGKWHTSAAIQLAEQFKWFGLAMD